MVNDFPKSNFILDVLQGPWLFHEGGSYYIETSPLICSAGQWTGFYMIETSVIREFKAIQKCGRETIQITRNRNFG